MSNNKDDKISKLSMSFELDDADSLVPDEDEEFEREAAQRRRNDIADEEERAREAERQLEQEKRDYQRKLQQERIALLKAKQGVEDEDADSDEDQGDQDEEPVKMSFKKRLENFWYHYKWVTIISVVVGGLALYMIYDLVTKVEPDIMIIATVDNGLSYRADEAERLFEKYCDDLNGDGKVYVQIMFAPMSEDSQGGTLSQDYETKLFASLANGQSVILLTDDDSFFALETVPFDDMSEKLDSGYITEDGGISLDSKLIRDGFNWAQMPDDMVLMIRTPVRTLYSSLEDMQESYDNSMVFIERLVAAMEEYDQYFSKN